MEVIYSGPNPLTYRAAPSATAYVFDPGVPQKVKPMDEEFFTDMAQAPNSPWKVVTLTEKVGEAVELAAEAVKTTMKTIKKGGRR